MIFLYITLLILLLLVHFVLADMTRMIIFDTKSLQAVLSNWKYIKWILLIPAIPIIFLIVFTITITVESLANELKQYLKD
jgi:hypothetical protein